MKIKHHVATGIHALTCSSPSVDSLGLEPYGMGPISRGRQTDGAGAWPVVDSIYGTTKLEIPNQPSIRTSLTHLISIYSASLHFYPHNASIQAGITKR